MEILVVIAITGIILWLTLSIYLFGQRYFITWNKSMNLQNEVHVIIQGISEDIFRAERIAGFDANKLALQMDDQNERIYQVKDGTLLRNEQKLTGESIYLSAFNVTAHKESPWLSRRNGLDRAEAGKVSLFEISLSLTNGTDTLSVTRAVHLRKPSNWNFF